MKNIEWVKEEISDIERKVEDELYTEDTGFRMTTRLSGMIDVIQEIKKVINQLDEPEVLSQEFINEKAVEVYADTADAEVHAVFRMRDLQNLLVPKQERIEEGRARLIVGFDGGTESYYATDIGDALDFLTDYDARFTVSKEPVIPRFVAHYIEEGKDLGCDLGTAMTVQTEMLKDIRDYIKNNEELFARAWLDGYRVEEEEQKYYVVKSEGLDGVHYYFTKFDDEMNGLFTRPNDKKEAYRFDDKEKAQAIANYTDSKVEELE